MMIWMMIRSIDIEAGKIKKKTNKKKKKQQKEQEKQTKKRFHKKNMGWQKLYAPCIVLFVVDVIIVLL